MKYCTSYAALLDLYVDGELSPEELEAVRTHLAVCPGCQTYVNDALAMRAAFPSVEETQVPEGFAQSVISALPPRKAAPARRKAVWMKTVLPLAACVAIVLLVQNGPFRPATTAQDTGAPEAALYDAEDSAVTGAAPAEGAPEEAPGASANSLPEASSPRLFAAPASGDAPALTLTAQEAGDLLAAYTPIQESDSAFTYELTAQQFETLTAALNAAGVLDTAPTPDGNTLFVAVLK